MDRKAFFDAVRKRPFGGSLSQGQVDGMSVLLDVWRELYPDASAHWIANSLAQIHRETGGRMEPVRETFASSDAQAIARLDDAWRKGKLTWVKTPYWRDGWYGRGHIQLTHESNYTRMARRLGVDLVGNPSLALDPRISAKVAIVGMVEGLFTGKKLGDYGFPAALDAPSRQHPRRIVNGPDGTDKLIARMHRDFHDALVLAGYVPGQAEAPTPEPEAPVPSTPAPTPPKAPTGGIVALIVRILARIFGGRS